MYCESIYAYLIDYSPNGAFQGQSEWKKCLKIPISRRLSSLISTKRIVVQCDLHNA